MSGNIGVSQAYSDDREVPLESVKAVQTQLRTHARSGRGRRRRAAGAELPAIPGEATCSSCSGQVARDDVLFSEAGAVCIPCHQEAQPPSAPSPVSDALWSGLLAAGLWAAFLGTLAQLLAQDPSPSYFREPLWAAWGPWVVLIGLAAVAAMFHGLRQARARWHLTERPIGHWLALGSHVLSAALTGLLALASTALVFLPLLGG